MELKTQKRLAATILKCSPKKIVFDTDRLQDIKEAITKTDIRALISEDVIIAKPARGVSRGRAREAQKKKSKGRQKGHGSRKGKKTARTDKKETWMNKVRAQRSLAVSLKTNEKLESKDFRSTYLKIKGGFFRSKRHLLLYLNERGLIKK